MNSVRDIRIFEEKEEKKVTLPGQENFRPLENIIRIIDSRHTNSKKKRHIKKSLCPVGKISDPLKFETAIYQLFEAFLDFSSESKGG